MRWSVFAIFALLGVTLESGFLQVFTLRWLGNLTPSFVACLVVFLSLFAGRWTALWACWILGLLMDLCVPRHPLPLVGLHALGYVAGCYAILQMRTMVFRRRVITIGLLTFVCLIAVTVVGNAIYLIRSWYSDGMLSVYPSALEELLRGLGVAIYSLLLAIPVGWLLVRTVPWWGFQTVTYGRKTRW